MNIEEGNALVSKVSLVILSCKTEGQLNVAIRYASLAYIQLAKTMGLANSTKCHVVFDRSIGYAQCQIKHGVDV